jgi:cycloeucalenol cycloisomerase
MAAAKGPTWLCTTNPSKRWAEVFFLAYSPLWMIWALCILVPFQLYEVRMSAWRHASDGPLPSLVHSCSLPPLLPRPQYCEEWGYLLIGLSAGLPCLILPMFIQSKADLAKPWHQRYWVKVSESLLPF